MEYTDQFIRLNCSLMLDYRMMKLNAEMKCVGMGLYLDMMLFLRKQKEYKHDFNKLDLLAEQWGTTVENVRHLIKDFDLFEITDDGYFRCLYLDEVMNFQQKISEQRAVSGSKGGKSGKKTTAKISAKAVEKVVLDTSENDERSMGKKLENDERSMKKEVKNTMEESEEENEDQISIQPIDNECDSMGEQASFKQNPKREEKNREEKKKKNDLDITKRKIEGDFDQEEDTAPIPRWEQCIDEAFATRSWVETVGMMSGLKGRFLSNIPFICSLFKKHVVTQGSTGRINSLSDAENYFANYIRAGKPTRLFLEEKLKEKEMAQSASAFFSPYENYDPLTGVRSYYGIPLPKDAPPRPNGRANWDGLKKSWI